MDSTKPTEVDWEERQEVLRQHAAVRMLRLSIPARFDGVRISNFKVADDKQRMVIETLCDICRNIDSFCSAVNQLFIWGRVGTGKDHLAIATAKQAALAGYSCRWYDAATLYESMTNWTTREKAISHAREPDIIILSDAVCNRNWTEAKQLAIRRIVNDRWNSDKATWVTANVTAVQGNDPNSAETLMVKDTLDRLLDGAALIHCDWGSHRATRSWTAR